MTNLKHRLSYSLFILSTISIYFGGFNRSYASALPYMPPPTTPIFATENFEALTLRGLSFDPQDPLKLKFILDQGDGEYSKASLEEETFRLVQYFLAAVTIPQEDIWVNLSPYEEDQVTSYPLEMEDSQL